MQEIAGEIEDIFDEIARIESLPEEPDADWLHELPGLLAMFKDEFCMLQKFEKNEKRQRNSGDFVKVFRKKSI